MTITPAIEGPTKPIKGADHKTPAIHWRLAPGGAWLLDVFKAPEDAMITEDMARKAEYTFCTMLIKGVGAALFTLGGKEYAQPTGPLPSSAGRRRKRETRAPRREAPGVAPEVSPGEGTPAPRREVRKPRGRKPLALEPL